MGLSILESYSRVLESLANTVMSRIEDVLYADSIAQDPSLAVSKRKLSMESTPSPSSAQESSPVAQEETEKSTLEETLNSMTLSDFMGWSFDQGDNDGAKTQKDESAKEEDDKSAGKPPKIATDKKFSYTDKVETGGLRSPTARH